MTVQLLSPAAASALKAAPLSFAGRWTETDEVPPGYRHFELETRLRRRDFEGATRDLMGWLVHERAGLRVHASEVTARLGTVVDLRLGLGALSVHIPCRVVHVFDEPRRTGFAYATLPGHPESGEERFVLDHDTNGDIRFTVAAVSRPATMLARLGGPVSRAVQDRMTRRYLAALDHL